MVAFGSHVIWFLSLTAVGLSSPLGENVARRDVDAVKAHLASISTKVQALDTAITNFPLQGGSLVAALGIHNSATALITNLDEAAAEVTATGPVGDEEGPVILQSVAAFEPFIKHALTEIVVKKPAFQALPIGGLPTLIRQDLTGLKASTDAFGTSLVENAPEFLHDAAAGLRDGILEAFDVAIAGYTA